MPDRPRILVAEPLDFDPEALEVLGRVADVELRATDDAGLSDALARYDAVWIRLGVRVQSQHLDGARARFIAVPTTGLDHIDLVACERRGIRVLSLRGEETFLKSIRATAELTVGLILALVRRIPSAAESVRRGEWNRDAFRGTELSGRAAGIVGVGRLGSMVARILRAVGMEVYGFDVRTDFPSEVATRVPTLHDLLAKSDVVSLHVPYDDRTQRLMGAPELRAMKTGAFLVNTSRGGVLDEEALIEALDSGKLAGAALDVLTGEPGVDATHPLVRWSAAHPERLVIVPHIGGNTRESIARAERFIAERLASALSEDG